MDDVRRLVEEEHWRIVEETKFCIFKKVVANIFVLELDLALGETQSPSS